MKHLTNFNLNQNKLIKTYRMNAFYVYITSFIFFLSATYFLSLIYKINAPISLLLLVLLILYTAYSIAKKLKCKYLFHEYSMFVEQGIFNTSKDIIEYFRIVDIQKKQPIYLRIFNLAIYHIYTNDINENHIILRAVINDDDFFFLTLREQINISRLKYRLLETI